MKRLIILLSLVALLFLIIPLIYAEQTNAPTQQYNKIFLNPFYRESLVLNTNYSYNVTVNPPDKISSILSTILSFNAQINGQTQTFFIWVNGQPCNNANYSVATAFSTTGNVQFSFDCSNRITKAGVYNITMRSSVNTGAMNGWLDLTYMNNPGGSLQISGTEYSPNDPATIFVQLKDSYGNAVSNGTCYLDIWSPNNASNVHPYVIEDSPMLQALGDDGIYYYDIIAPSIMGVHMLSAKCSYVFNWIWIYPKLEEVYFPIVQRYTGNWMGGAQSLNSKEDSLYERCDATAGVLCQSNYTFNLSQYGLVTNITTVSLYFSGQGDVAGKVVTFAYWNGTAFVNLPNTWTIVATGASATAPGGVDQFVTNSIPLNAIISNNIIIRYTGQIGLARYYHNWLSLALLTSSGTIQDVKGSSEMHITNIPSASANQTWSFNGSIAQNITDQITNSTWTYNGTISSNVVTQLNNLTILGPLVAGYIWNSSNRSLNYTDNIASAIWSYNGTITPNIIQTLVNNTWAYTGTISSNILNQFTNSVWAYNGNSTTFMVQTVVNATWEYTGGRYTHGVILS